jgi:undecaprenyl-diphosphatase
VFLGAGAAALLLQVGLRYAVAHWRPDAVAPAAGADWVMRYELAGFTSGHALRSAYLFGWWADALRRWGGPAAGVGALGCLAAAAAVGCTRVYLNRHWLTDVVGAWLIAGWALTIAAAARGRAARHG